MNGLARSLLLGVFVASLAFSYAIATGDGVSTDTRGFVAQELGSGLGTALPLAFGNSDDLGSMMAGSVTVRQFWGIGGVKPYKFECSELPTWCTLSAAGLLTVRAPSNLIGVPFGSLLKNVRLTDALGTVVLKDFLFTMLDPLTVPADPKIANIDLYGQANNVTLGGMDPDWQLFFAQRATGPEVALGAIPLGESYFGQLSAVGGEPPYSWSYTGNLPKGLSMSEDGVITGIPYEASTTYNFVPALEDNAGTAAGNPVPITGIDLVTGEYGVIGTSLTVLNAKASFYFAEDGKDAVAISALLNGFGGGTKASVNGANFIMRINGTTLGPIPFDAKGKATSVDGVSSIAVKFNPVNGKLSVKGKKLSDVAEVFGIAAATSVGGLYDMVMQVSVNGNDVSFNGTCVPALLYAKKNDAKGMLVYNMGKVGQLQSGSFQIMDAKIKDADGGSVFNVKFLAQSFEGVGLSLAAGSSLVLGIGPNPASAVLPAADFDQTNGNLKFVGVSGAVKKLHINAKGQGNLITQVIPTAQSGVPLASTQAVGTAVSVPMGMEGKLGDGTPFNLRAGVEVYSNGKNTYGMKK